MEKVVLGVDVGYGNVKVVGKGVKLIFPSSVAPFRETLGLGFGSPEVIELKSGESFLVGSSEGVDLRTKSFHTSPEWRALLYRALADTPITLHVVLGLPASLAVREQRKELEQKLKGLHEFLYRGEPRGVRMVEARVIAQGMGVLLDYFISEEDVRVDPQKKEESIIVIDVGFYTTDVFLYRDGRLVEEKSQSFEVGVSHYLEENLTFLKTEYHYPSVSLKEIEKVVKRGYASVRGKRIDVSEVALEVLHRWQKRFSSIANAYENELATYDTLVVAGGGAYLIDANTFGRVAVIPEEPEYANARGFWKFGEVTFR